MKRLIYIICGIIAAGIATAITIDSINENGSKPMSPEEVAETFCIAIATGDFTQARSLCDMSSMSEYIRICARNWDFLANNDSTVVSIAKEMMGGICFRIDNNIKDGNTRRIDYTISIGEGLKKSKTMSLKKEEGEWRVTMVTNRE